MISAPPLCLESAPALPAYLTSTVFWSCQIKTICFQSQLDLELSVPWQNDLTKMDPASASELRDFLSRSNSRMDHQDEQTAVSNRAIQTLVSQVSKLTTQLQRLQTEPEQRPTASNSPAPTIPDQAARFIEPRLPPPAFYSGEPQLCRSFLAKCSLYISLQPSSFPTEESKIAFVITLLSGRAALWGTTVWEQKLPCCTSFQSFSEEIRKVFDRAASGREAARFLAELRQGDRSVTDFSIEFRTLAAECRWNPEAQWDMFFHGLADYVNDEIYALELPTSLDGLVSLAIRVDARLQQRGQRARRTSANNRLDHLPIPYRDADIGFAEPDPMQMGRSRLSLEEKAEKCVFHAQSVPFLGYIVSVEGMRMDPDRVQAVVDWPTPDSRKALQRFLGFANFYRRFSRSFSQLAAPLTALTSIKTPFRWSSAAEAAFTKLKGCFVSAPILIAPDPSRQFVVEVDASEVGVGAVLSERSSSDDKVHPCAYFSHRLSPAERNYDIGNRELLAVKLALEEWRHWLEGSGVPFIVWTDHKNLEYIKSAKRLNSRQARWALFFGRFDFSISYRPGFQEHQARCTVPYFRPFWSPVFFRAHCATENFCFCGHLGDWVEGPHGLARGNASVRMPTGSFVCARDFTVRCHSMESLFQGGLSSWGESYHVSY